MDYRSADNITTWFVRRRTVGAGAQDDATVKHKGKGRDSKEAEAGTQQSRSKQPAQTEGKQNKQKQAAHGAAPTEKKAANPVLAAAAAVAAAAAEKTASVAASTAEKTASVTAALSEKKHAAGQDQKQSGTTAAASAEKRAGEKKTATAAAPADAKAAAPPAADAAAQERRRRPAPDSDSDSDGELAAAPGGREQAVAAAAEQQRAERERELEEAAEYRPRVVAYSDSDSDVESHFKRVKTHLLPPSEEQAAERAAAEAAAAVAAAADEAAAAEALRQQAGLRRLRRAVGAAAGSAGRAAAPHATPGLAARAGGLLLLSRAHPHAAAAAGLLGAAVPLAEAAAARAGLDLAAALPRPLLAASRELGQLGKAAVALSAGRLLLRGLCHQQRRRKERRQRRGPAGAAVDAAGQTDAAAAEPGQPPATPGRLLRRKSSVNLAALADYAALGAAIERRQPETAAEWAAVYSAEMREMRRMLQENEVELPPERFDATNAELLRFAKACGLLTAKNPEQRAAALEAGVSRVVHTMEWTARQRFATERELRRWDRLLSWKARDAGGRPILLARVGRAQQLVKPERYEDLASVLLTLVHRGVSSQLRSEGAGEQMVVVLDCRGGSSMGLSRHTALLKRLAVTLNQHYPDRLYRLHLLELPLLLRWVLHAVTPLLHPNTRGKLVFSSADDLGLPVTVALLSKRRSAAKLGGMSRSMSNCSFPSSGDATPALMSPRRSAGLSLLPALEEAAAAASGSLPAGCDAPSGEGDSWRQPAQQQQQQPADDEPNTPPPTLKVPHSPREVCRPRALQLQAAEAPQEAPPAEHCGAGHLRQQQPSPSLLKRKSFDDPPAAAPPSSAMGQEPPRSSASQCSGAASSSLAAAAAAGLLPAAAAASASAGLTSHAVPWSSAMQSPTGSLSRDASYGDEAVPAARAKAAADAVRELEQWQQQAATAMLQARLETASRTSGQPAPQQCAASAPAIHPPGSSAQLPSPTAPGVEADGGTSASTLAEWLGGLLPSQWGRGARASGEPAPCGRPAGRPLVHQLPLAGQLAAGRVVSSADSTPRTPQRGRSRRRAGGLVDLPDRPSRLTSSRGLTPRKSSLRRSESADVLPTSRSKLGSHPLRRQSSVSWAEELESVKEIMPRCGLPTISSPPRRRLAEAAAAQPQAVLMACCVALLGCLALLQRLLLSVRP